MLELPEFSRTCPMTGLPCQRGCPWIGAGPRDWIDAAIGRHEVVCMPAALLQGLTDVSTIATP